MSSHLPTHKSFLHIKCIIHWPNCTRLTRQIWGKLKPTYIIPTVQVDTLTNSKAAEPRRPSLTCCTITYHLHNHQISSSQSSNIIFTIIKYHLHNHQGRQCHWLLTILRPMKAITIMSNFLLVMIPNMIAWKKWKSHEEFFFNLSPGVPSSVLEALSLVFSRPPSSLRQCTCGDNQRKGKGEERMFN